ncbi:MAG TPA: DUF3857 domain-containing protein [Candidatus Acidoferrum sp.]
MTKRGNSLSQVFAVCAITLLIVVCPSNAQETKSTLKDSKPAPTEKNAAQIELLETKYRFEANGDSRKEVHTRVRINNELGVRQFARLNFDFNRSFQSVEIPQVRITHASGGTADILPSAITDNPNPAVVNYPAYQDVRVKSVRILGLQPGDLLEYRVITTITHHPLAPDFWLDHTFDRSGVVSQEIFELDLPAVPSVQTRINPAVLPASTRDEKDGESIRKIYEWNWKPGTEVTDESPDSDIAVSTFASWPALRSKLSKQLEAAPTPMTEAERKVVTDLTSKQTTYSQKLRAIYDFVSQKTVTVELPLGATGFQTRSPDEIQASRYATAEDKFVLFYRMLGEIEISRQPAFVGIAAKISERLPSPSLLSQLLTVAGVSPGPFPGAGCGDCETYIWLDLTTGVAPFGVIPSSIRGHEALVGSLGIWQQPHDGFLRIPRKLPFDSTQSVVIKAQLNLDGALTARAKYTMRGDNELLLRVAFHKTAKEKWKDVAQMLALSDGFRGQIVNVAASDPYVTDEPFQVEYEISQPKFVDWSKKLVRIPALLPLPGLPDVSSTATHSANGGEKKSIDLGTPLAIDLEATIELPAGATAQAPVGTTVNRDYATFTSKYSVQGNTLHASRKLHFISSELPATRAGDLNAFLHAVQADQSQLFTVESAEKH